MAHAGRRLRGTTAAPARTVASVTVLGVTRAPRRWTDRLPVDVNRARVGAQVIAAAAAQRETGRAQRQAGTLRTHLLGVADGGARAAVHGIGRQGAQ